MHTYCGRQLSKAKNWEAFADLLLQIGTVDRALVSTPNAGQKNPHSEKI